MPADPVTDASGQRNPGGQSKTFQVAVFGFAVVVLLLIGFGLYQSEGRFLLQLQDTAVSRGLITFLVAVVTVSIALAIAVWVIASNEEAETIKARFSYAKDVLATLVGILGTVLGFYFGSADKPATEQLALADLQFKSGQVITHVSGGTAPFRYTITPSDGDPKNATRVSKDGWIFEPVPESVKAGTAIAIEVVDSKDRKASRTLKYQTEQREPSPAPSASTQRVAQGSGQGAIQPQTPTSPASR